MTTVVEDGTGGGEPDAGTGSSGDLPFRDKALVPTLVLVGALVAIVSSLGALLIPSIARADHVSLSTAQWLLTAALLTGALATPIMGRLADGPRQRDVILGALAVVLVGCVLAAVSDQFIVVVAGRALQGFGLGLLPVTMAIARRHLSVEKAGRTIATLSITVAVGGGLGYPLTGSDHPGRELPRRLLVRRHHRGRGAGGGGDDPARPIGHARPPLRRARSGDPQPGRDRAVWWC